MFFMKKCPVFNVFFLYHFTETFLFLRQEIFHCCFDQQPFSFHFYFIPFFRPLLRGFWGSFQLQFHCLWPYPALAPWTVHCLLYQGTNFCFHLLPSGLHPSSITKTLYMCTFNMHQLWLMLWTEQMKGKKLMMLFWSHTAVSGTVVNVLETRHVQL